MPTRAYLHKQTTSIATVTFTNVGDLGIAWKPVSGQERVALPQQIEASRYTQDLAKRRLALAFAGSVATGDLDADGDSDLCIVGSDGMVHLFQNTGDAGFTEITDRAGLAGIKGFLSATFADYNRSGYPSLFLAGAGSMKLYHNRGNGTFVDRTEKAGFHANPSELYTRAILSDVDEDGFPDLLLTAYTDLSALPPKITFVFPDDFRGVISRLYHNNGGGTFTDITAGSGLESNSGRARNAVFADFNGDRRIDILLLRDDKPPALYFNQGQGRFEERTWQAGEQIVRNAFFDAQPADFNRDGKPDLILYSPLGSRVLLNDGGGRFQPLDPLSTTVSYPANLVAFHGTVADVDGDGSEDLLAVDAEGNWQLFLNVSVWRSQGSGARGGPASRREISNLTESATVQPRKYVGEVVLHGDPHAAAGLYHG